MVLRTKDVACEHPSPASDGSLVKYDLHAQRPWSEYPPQLAMTSKEPR